MAEYCFEELQFIPIYKKNRNVVAYEALNFCGTGPDLPEVTVKNKIVSYYDQVIRLHCEIQPDAYEDGASLWWTDPHVRLHVFTSTTAYIVSLQMV